MKEKIVLVGGSNGIGLAIAIELIKRGYYIIIVDRSEPDYTLLKNENNYSFIQSDLICFQFSVFETLMKDMSVKGLIITAGFGRVTTFENISLEEIDNMFAVNSVALVKILNIFYARIMAKEDFYVAVMGSIAGLVSSPMFSVYAATKASVCRLVESVNIELEEKGTYNRILNVSPGSIKGTKFNGGENNLSLMGGVAKEIVDKMFLRETLFIPQYEEIFKSVIEQYQKDPHAYGLHSYEYKLKSGRIR